MKKKIITVIFALASLIVCAQQNDFFKNLSDYQYIPDFDMPSLYGKWIMVHQEYSSVRDARDTLNTYKEGEIIIGDTFIKNSLSDESTSDDVVWEVYLITHIRSVDGLNPIPRGGLINPFFPNYTSWKGIDGYIYIDRYLPSSPDEYHYLIYDQDKDRLIFCSYEHNSIYYYFERK